MKARWTGEEIVLLGELYPEGGYEACVGKIFRSRKAINHMAHRLNIKVTETAKAKIFSLAGTKACLAYSGAGEMNPNWKGGVSKNTYRYKLRMKAKYPKKYKARNITASLIRAGKIKKEPCLVCCDVQSQVHHLDYDYPECVIWLCRKHHDLIHKVHEEQ